MTLYSPLARRLAPLVVLAVVGACAETPRAEGPGAAPTPAPPASRAPGEPSPYGDFLAARQAERSFDTDRAAELFARTLSHAPDNPALMRQALHQMIASGRLIDAAGLARRYVEHEPESVVANLAMAVVELREDDPAGAAKLLTAIPARGLGGYFVPLALAWTKVAAGDPDSALAALAPLARLRGGEPFHDYHAALILDLAGEPARAAAFFDRLGANGFAGQARIVQMAGAFFERRGEAAKAREIYRHFLESQLDSQVIEAAVERLEAGRPAPREIATARDGAAEALFNLAMLLSQESVPEIAMMLTQMALELRPGFDAARLLRGDILESAGRDEEAIEAYGRIKPDSPLSWEARLRAAHLLDRTGKTEVALARLRDMSREEPEHADALIAQGDILRFKKRYGEAVEAYDAAFRRIGTPNARYWGLYYARGIALERSKQWDRAEVDFLKALEFRPEQPFVLNYLGYSWVEQGRNLDRALSMIEKAVELRPNDGYIVDSLGWAHYQMDSFDNAVTHLERAVELASQDATINDHLGDAYWRVGRHYEARFQWRRALALEPEPGEVAAIERKLAHGLGGMEGKRESAGAERGRSGG